MNCLPFTISGALNLYHNRCSEFEGKNWHISPGTVGVIVLGNGIHYHPANIVYGKKSFSKACFLERGKHDNHVYN